MVQGCLPSQQHHQQEQQQEQQQEELTQGINNFDDEQRSNSIIATFLLEQHQFSSTPLSYLSCCFSLTNLLNLLFLIGSILYTVIGVWDLRDAIIDKRYYNDNNDDYSYHTGSNDDDDTNNNDDDKSNDDDSDDTASGIIYFIVYCLAAFAYVLQSIVHVTMLVFVSVDNDDASSSSSSSSSQLIISNNNDNDDNNFNHVEIEEQKDETLRVQQDDDEQDTSLLPSSSSSQYVLMDDNNTDNNNADNNNRLLLSTPCCSNVSSIKVIQVIDSILFGVASIFDLLSSLSIDFTSSIDSTIFGFVAVHTYLIQAILTVVFGSGDLSGSNSSTRSIKNERLERYGDLLFLLGAVVDVISSYLYITPSIDKHTIDLAIWSLFSNILWFIDSILYML